MRAWLLIPLLLLQAALAPLAIPAPHPHQPAPLSCCGADCCCAPADCPCRPTPTSTSASTRIDLAAAPLRAPARRHAAAPVLHALHAATDPSSVARARSQAPRPRALAPPSPPPRSFLCVWLT